MSPKSVLLPLLFLSVVCLLPSHAEEGKKEPSAVAKWQAANARRAATTLLQDLRILDAASDQWAIENNKRTDAVPTPQDLAIYVKKGTRLHAELAAGRLNDALGNAMTLRGVPSGPLISKKSVEHFATAVQAGFWGAYYEGPEISTGPAPEPEAPPQPAPANPVTKTELRTTAFRLLEEMRMIDAAVDQWAIEKNKRDGDQPIPSDLIVYIKPGTRLHAELAAGHLNDSLGNPISIPPVGKAPIINESTAKRLSTVAPSEFWGPFIQK